jgi:hypothetical protein
VRPVASVRGPKDIAPRAPPDALTIMLHNIRVPRKFPLGVKCAPDRMRERYPWRLSMSAERKP